MVKSYPIHVYYKIQVGFNPMFSINKELLISCIRIPKHLSYFEIFSEKLIPIIIKNLIITIKNTHKSWYIFLRTFLALILSHQLGSPDELYVQKILTL